MAFKLSGDQYTQQRVARKRRVVRLLVEGIPQSEVKRLRDGRYACLVCSSRPVFDTVAMLSVHRGGKRHLNSSHAQLKKQELDTIEELRRSHSHKVAPPLLAEAAKLTTALLSSPGADVHSAGVDTHSQQLLQHKDLRTCLMVAENEKECEREKEYVFPWQATKRRERKINDNHQHVTEQQPAIASGVDYTKARSKGWLLQQDGRWMRNPDMEFDSDEEEPPPLYS